MMGVIEKVYRQPAANRWLASLSPFVLKHMNCPEMVHIVESNLNNFIERNILPYNRPELPVSFVGSIAYFYNELLHQVLKSHGLSIGLVLRSPLDSLKIV